MVAVMDGTERAATIGGEQNEGRGMCNLRIMPLQNAGL